MFTSTHYWRARLVNFRIGLPMLAAAVALSPVGARLTPHVDQRLLLSLFAGFLLVAGALMRFHRARARRQPLGRAVEFAAGVGVGGAAGFLGDCWGSVAGTSSCRC